MQTPAWKNLQVISLYSFGFLVKLMSTKSAVNSIAFARLLILYFCSPSQGPCCTGACEYKSSDERCRPESECAMEGKCNGVTALCPASAPKENLTSCHAETQVCIKGVCSF